MDDSNCAGKFGDPTFFTRISSAFGPALGEVITSEKQMFSADVKLETPTRIYGPQATAVAFVNNNTSDVLFVDKSCCATRVDLQKKRQIDYYSSYNANTPKGILSNCWFRNLQFEAGHIEEVLIGATNSLSTTGGYIAWDAKTRQLLSSVVHQDFQTPAGMINHIAYWHASYGKFLLAGAGASSEVRMYSVLDGTIFARFNLQSNLDWKGLAEPFQCFSPSHILIGEEATVALYDVSTGVGKPLLTYNGGIDEMRGIWVSGANKCPSESSSTSMPYFDAFYCTGNGIYTMDFRAKTASSYHARGFVRVHSVFGYDNQILVGGTETQSPYMYQRSEKLLQWDVRMGNCLTSYHLPCQTEIAKDTRIKQIWADDRFVLAVNGSKLYVYNNVLGTGVRNMKCMYKKGEGLRYVIGPFTKPGVPSFDVLDNVVVIAAPNDAPQWSFLA